MHNLFRNEMSSIVCRYVGRHVVEVLKIGVMEQGLTQSLVQSQNDSEWVSESGNRVYSAGGEERGRPRYRCSRRYQCQPQVRLDFLLAFALHSALSFRILHPEGDPAKLDDHMYDVRRGVSELTFVVLRELNFELNFGLPFDVG